MSQSESKQQEGGVAKNKTKLKNTLLVKKFNLLARQLEAFSVTTNCDERKCVLRSETGWNSAVIKKHHYALTLKVQGSEKIINSTPAGVTVSLSL